MDVIEHEIIRSAAPSALASTPRCSRRSPLTPIAALLFALPVLFAVPTMHSTPRAARREAGGKRHGWHHALTLGVVPALTAAGDRMGAGGAPTIV